MYPEKTLIQKDTCTPMFTAALSAKGKTQRQPKCPLTDEWMKEMRSVYTVECYSDIERMTSCHLQQRGWTYRLSYEVKQDKERQIYDITSRWNLKEMIQMNLFTK